MTRSHLLVLWAVALALWPWGSLAAQEKKTPDTLTAEDVRKRMDEFLTDPGVPADRKTDLEEAGKLVRLNTAGLDYKKAGPDYRLVWAVAPVGGKPLAADEEKRVKTLLADALAHV